MSPLLLCLFYPLLGCLPPVFLLYPLPLLFLCQTVIWPKYMVLCPSVTDDESSEVKTQSQNDCYFPMAH